MFAHSYTSPLESCFEFALVCNICVSDVFVWLAGIPKAQLGFHLIVCAVGAECDLYREPDLPVAVSRWGTVVTESAHSLIYP